MYIFLMTLQSHGKIEGRVKTLVAEVAGPLMLNRFLTLSPSLPDMEELGDADEEKSIPVSCFLPPFPFLNKSENTFLKKCLFSFVEPK